MSSPAASSGVHRAPDTARERRCAELTAGAEREDAPSRTGHLTQRAVPAPSRTCSPHAPAAPAAEPYAARRDPGGHEPIEEWRILLQHHDIVTGEAIVAGNVLEERHRAARRSARRAAPSRTTSSERNRPRLPRTEPSALSGARRHASGWPPSKAHTAERRYNAGERAHGGAHPSKIRADAPSARPSNGPGPPSGTPLGRPHRAARRSGPSPPSRTLPERTRCGAVFETVARIHRQRCTHPDAHLRERRRVQRLQPWQQEQGPTRPRAGRSPRRATHSS